MEIIRRHPELEIFFQDVDYTDVKRIEGDVSLRGFLAGMLSYSPSWLVALYRLREVLVKILGLVKHEKPEGLPSIRPEEISFEPGSQAGFFIVKSAREDVHWVSETPEDKHLKAYFGVVAEAAGERPARFHVFTAVKFIHWTGPVYFNLIRPFHHLVVWRMMKAGARKR